MNRLSATWFLIAVSLGLALFTGSRLKQAVDGERDLTSQIADLSAAEKDARNAALSGAVDRGIASLSTALSEIRTAAHRNELALAAEVFGLIAGITLLRTGWRRT